MLALGLLAALPERVALLPGWAPYTIVIGQLGPTALVVLTRGNAAALRIERIATLLYFLVAVISTVAGLAFVIRRMVSPAVEIDGLHLLASSAVLWVTNVIAFSMLYWQLDRGGPERRKSPGRPNPDWLFPQDGASGFVPPEWRPTFPDYLFLGFSTATAFSTTDVMPLTIRAKMLMMFESSVSLATIILVAARAVNILGGPT